MIDDPRWPRDQSWYRWRRSRIGYRRHLCFKSTDPEAAHWEQLLASEGMPAELPRKYIRETTANTDGERPWKGPREVGAVSLDERRQRPPRPDTLIEQLMAEPHTPEEHTSTELQELREHVLDVMDETLTPAEIELVTAAHMGGGTLTETASRLGMPYATAWYACDRARTKLREALEGDQRIQEYLEG